MSNQAWGYIEFSGESNGLEEPTFVSDSMKDFAFRIVCFAARIKIGIKFGGNITREHLKTIIKKPTILPFELMDDPILNVAHRLFSCEASDVYEHHDAGEAGESVISRMSRVQDLFKEIFMSDKVKQIVFNIDSMLGEEEPQRTVSVDQFKNLMLSLFLKNNNCAPYVQIIMTR